MPKNSPPRPSGTSPVKHKICSENKPPSALRAPPPKGEENFSDLLEFQIGEDISPPSGGSARRARGAIIIPQSPFKILALGRNNQKYSILTDLRIQVTHVKHQIMCYLV